MSSTTRAFSAGPSTPARAPTSRKRLLSDSEDTGSGEAQREVKRTKGVSSIALDGGVEPNRESREKDKKRRRKKKRKMSVVVYPASGNGSGGEVQGRSSTRTGRRGRSTSLRSSSVTLDSIRTTPGPLTQSQPASVPPSHQLSAQSSSAIKTQQRSRSPAFESPPSVSDKGKGKCRASPEGEARQTPSEAPSTTIDQVHELTAEITTKTDLVTKHSTLLSAIQHSLTCQICLDLMYKPYALAPCGHTACHSCLVAWFKAPPPDARPQDVLPTWLRKKTCPHCRAVVKERPIGVWTVKDMVAALVKSGLAAAAFPPSPAPDAEVPTADPWEGIFRREPGASGNHRQVFPGPPPALFQQMLGLHDVEDGGIYRCIDCNHEIWDGVCSSCGRVYPGHGGGDDEDDYPEDYELEEAELAGLMFGGPYNILNHLHGDGSGDEGDSDGSLGAVNFGDGNTELNGSDDEDSEEDYESSFIDDDEHVVRDRLHSPRDHASEGSGGPLIRHRVGGGSSGNRPRPRARREVPRSSPIVISDGSDDVESISSVQDLPRLGRRARLVDSASDDETSIADAERDLSAVVAAREFDVYGDDGSVPRWRALRDIEDDEHNNY